MPEKIETTSQNIVQPKRKPRAAGVIALALIFFAAASLTWTYLADTASQTAAAAIVEPAPLAPAPVFDLQAFDGIALSAKSAMVVDETAGKVLYALNPDAQWPLASLTKIALTLVVAQALSPESTITIPFDTGAYNPHPAGELRTGEHWKLRDVIDFTIAVSSNKGADMLAAAANDAIHQAYPLSPATDATLWRMNELVQSLGLSRTYYLNDNGLDLSTTQAGAYGSARDMTSLLAYAASTTPTTFAATTLRTFSIRSLEGAKVKAINTDEALPNIPDVILSKTGYTDLAGGNLGVCFKVNGDTICAVVLGSTFDGRFADMEKLAAATQAALSHMR